MADRLGQSISVAKTIAAITIGGTFSIMLVLAGYLSAPTKKIEKELTQIQDFFRNAPKFLGQDTPYFLPPDRILLAAVTGDYSQLRKSRFDPTRNELAAQNIVDRLELDWPIENRTVHFRFRLRRFSDSELPRDYPNELEKEMEQIAAGYSMPASKPIIWPDGINRRAPHGWAIPPDGILGDMKPDRINNVMNYWPQQIVNVSDFLGMWTILTQLESFTVYRKAPQIVFVAIDHESERTIVAYVGPSNELKIDPVAQQAMTKEIKALKEVSSCEGLSVCLVQQRARAFRRDEDDILPDIRKFGDDEVYNRAKALWADSEHPLFLAGELKAGDLEIMAGYMVAKQEKAINKRELVKAVFPNTHESLAAERAAFSDTLKLSRDNPSLTLVALEKKVEQLRNQTFTISFSGFTIGYELFVWLGPALLAFLWALTAMAVRDVRNAFRHKNQTSQIDDIIFGLDTGVGKVIYGVLFVLVPGTLTAMLGMFVVRNYESVASQAGQLVFVSIIALAAIYNLFQVKGLVSREGQAPAT